MEPEGSLPHSQVPATCPYPEPDQSSPCQHPTSWRSILIVFSLLRLGLPSGFFCSGFPTETLYTSLLSLVSATCHANLFLIDFITRTILCEEYRSLRSSLCSFLQSLVTLSLLGPNVLLKTLFSNSLRIIVLILVLILILLPLLLLIIKFWCSIFFLRRNSSRNNSRNNRTNNREHKQQQKRNIFPHHPSRLYTLQLITSEHCLYLQYVDCTSIFQKPFPITFCLLIFIGTYFIMFLWEQISWNVMGRSRIKYKLVSERVQKSIENVYARNFV